MNFLGRLKERFLVRKEIIEQRMKFKGCVMDVWEEGGVCLSMHEYLERLAPIELRRNRKNESYALATQREISEYRSLAGTLMYLGTSVLPQTSLVTCLMQKESTPSESHT